MLPYLGPSHRGSAPGERGIGVLGVGDTGTALGAWDPTLEGSCVISLQHLRGGQNIVVSGPSGH